MADPKEKIADRIRKNAKYPHNVGYVIGVDPHRTEGDGHGSATVVKKTDGEVVYSTFRNLSEKKPDDKE